MTAARQQRKLRRVLRLSAAVICRWSLAAGLALPDHAATTERVRHRPPYRSCDQRLRPGGIFHRCRSRASAVPDFELRSCGRHLAVPQRRQHGGLRRRPRDLCAAIRRLRSGRRGARCGDRRVIRKSGSSTPNGFIFLQRRSARAFRRRSRMRIAPPRGKWPDVQRDAGSLSSYG